MAKGSEYERNISKFLTKWLTGKVKPYMYWRSDASGGLATVHEENIHMTGDIKHLHPDAKFLTDLLSIECKTGYKNTSFWQHFSPIKFSLQDFWSQACTDAEKASKHPLLIYRKKNRRMIVGIDKYLQERLIERLSDLNHIKVSWGKETSLRDCYIYDMEYFFGMVRPDDIRRIS